jgi:hypothetical protein
MLGSFIKFNLHIPILVQIGQNNLAFYMKTYVRFFAHLEADSSDTGICPEKSVSRHIVCAIHFSLMSYGFRRKKMEGTRMNCEVSLRRSQSEYPVFRPSTSTIQVKGVTAAPPHLSHFLSHPFKFIIHYYSHFKQQRE